MLRKRSGLERGKVTELRHFLDNHYWPQEYFQTPTDDKTIVCRCENVSVGEIRKVAASGRLANLDVSDNSGGLEWTCETSYRATTKPRSPDITSDCQFRRMVIFSPYQPICYKPKCIRF